MLTLVTFPLPTGLRVAAIRLYQRLGFRLRGSDLYRYQPEWAPPHRLVGVLTNNPSSPTLPLG